MPLLDHLTDSIKTAMKAKDSLQLDALRAIKAAVLMEKNRCRGNRYPHGGTRNQIATKVGEATP